MFLLLTAAPLAIAAPEQINAQQQSPPPALPAPPSSAPIEPDNYRMQAYQAPVPATLDGATVLDDQGAYALWQRGSAAFIDVLPRHPKPKTLPEDAVWRDRPRYSIPDAVWLPNVGYGAVTDKTIAYFTSGIEATTGGDKTKPLVFFCRAECWMSWNAAKRALSLGYAHVHWYPDGTDGWAANGWPTRLVEPFTAP